MKRRILITSLFCCMLFYTMLPCTSFAKDPTLKEKIAALAAEGKTIPVVYVVYTWDGIKGQQTRPPSIISQDLFKQKAVPDAYKSVVDNVIESLNTGYGVTCFNGVPFDSLPTKESSVFGKEPDWSAVDYSLYVSVVINGVYDLVLGQSSKSIKLTMKCEIKIMESIEKKGKKKSDTIKTLYATATTKPMTVKSAYSTFEEFTKDIPPESVVDDLKAAAAKEVGKYAGKK